MVLDVSVVDRTGKSVVMTISRQFTMRHVKLLLTSGTVPLLGRGLGPGDVTLQINGVVLADNMKVADLCNADENLRKTDQRMHFPIDFVP